MTRISDRTVLFADLRGSTALFETLGNAEATSVVTHCVAALCAPVTALRGRVVKTLGDGLMALFETPADTVKAAARMHDVLDAMVRRGDQRGASAGLRGLKLQVTAAHGEVVEMGDDAFGDAVNVAARLLDHAGDNETLITVEVLLGLPTDQRPRWRSLDRIALRGRAEPVQVHVLGGRRSADQVATQFGDVAPLVAEPDGLQLRWNGVERLFAGDQFPVILGRSPESVFRVDDSRVSRSHCRVDTRGGSLQLTDLSFNGTYVRFASGEIVSLRRGSCTLMGSGTIGLGGSPSDAGAPRVHFEVVRVGTLHAAAGTGAGIAWSRGAG